MDPIAEKGNAGPGMLPGTREEWNGERFFEAQSK
jgi:hypothetical protein